MNHFLYAVRCFLAGTPDRPIGIYLADTEFDARMIGDLFAKNTQISGYDIRDYDHWEDRVGDVLVSWTRGVGFTQN